MECDKREEIEKLQEEAFMEGYKALIKSMCSYALLQNG